LNLALYRLLQQPNIPAFTPDGRIVYYTMEVGADYVILVSRFQHGRWTQPEIASFSGKYSDAEPFMAPNGSKLFFASKRPLEAAGVDGTSTM
jgi:Tol biopolymer transport system component